MQTTEAELIRSANECDVSPPVASLLEALDYFWGNGFSDEQCGSTDELGHYYRVDRWIVQTDSQGFSDVFTFDTEAEAVATFAKIEAEQN